MVKFCFVVFWYDLAKAHCNLIVQDYFTGTGAVQPLLQWQGSNFEQPGPRLNIKNIFPRYGDSHVKDKTVARPSYL